MNKRWTGGGQNNKIEITINCTEVSSHNVGFTQGWLVHKTELKPSYAIFYKPKSHK